jgi:hypothetical protein
VGSVALKTALFVIGVQQPYLANHLRVLRVLHEDILQRDRRISPVALALQKPRAQQCL